MGCRREASVPLGLRILPVDTAFQIASAQGISRHLTLRHINRGAFSSEPLAQQGGHHNGRCRDKAEVIGIHALTTDGALLSGMVPQKGHAAEGVEIEAPGTVPVLRACFAQTRQFEDDDRWVDLPKLVVTEAEPDTIQNLFRRARLIGRRFRLAHVRMGREVVEVSTYRALPNVGDDGYEVSEGDGRILRDNVFGDRDSDARRRDFSVNALYYDPVGGVLLDYVGGFEDLNAGILRMIGEPLSLIHI